MSKPWHSLDRIQEVSLVLFAAALVILVLDDIWSLYWFAGATFVLLILSSGLTCGFGLVTKKMRLQWRGKLVVAGIIIGVMLFLFAPAIQTMPSSQGTGSYCDPSGCSSITQFESLSYYYFPCMGAHYSYSGPPAVEFFFYFDLGCPPVP